MRETSFSDPQCGCLVACWEHLYQRWVVHIFVGKKGGYMTHMLHGAGIFTNLFPNKITQIKDTIHGAYGI
jgi:hypothetical protein